MKGEKTINSPLAQADIHTVNRKQQPQAHRGAAQGPGGQGSVGHSWGTRQGGQDPLRCPELPHIVRLHRAADVHDVIGQRSPRTITLWKQPQHKVRNFTS